MAKLFLNVLLKVFIVVLILAGSLTIRGEVLAYAGEAVEIHDEEPGTQAGSREKISTASKEWWILLAGSMALIVVLGVGVRKFIQVPKEK